MLGAGRASVTEALWPLQDEGLTRCDRGRVVNLDGDGVEARSYEFYAVVRDEYDLLRETGCSSVATDSCGESVRIDGDIPFPSDAPGDPGPAPEFVNRDDQPACHDEDELVSSSRYGGRERGPPFAARPGSRESEGDRRI